MNGRLVPSPLCSSLLFIAPVVVGFLAAAAPAGPPVPGRIAFESDRSGSYQVWVMDANGSSQTRLGPFTDSESFDPAWSPDGKQLVFENASRNGKYSDLWLMNADGSNPKRLTAMGTPTRNPAWSPDGTKIAFQNNRTGNYAIYWMRPKPRAVPNNLTLGLKNCTDPAWSADGKKIAFVYNGHIYVMNAANGKGRVQLTKAPGGDANPFWSPDGKSIAFGSNRSGSSQIWVISTSGRSQRQLTGRSGSDGQNFDPSWSPDGKTIAFSSNRDGNLEIYSMNTNGTNQTRLTNDRGVDLVPNYRQPLRR